jgi:hypothetical protein
VVEHFIGNEEAAGSIPANGSRCFFKKRLVQMGRFLNLSARRYGLRLPDVALFRYAVRQSGENICMSFIRHSTVQVGPANVFYREAGTQGLPVLLLLHGFANSSHYFRHLMPKLADRFHLVAPDLPSFGFTTIEEGADYQ